MEPGSPALAGRFSTAKPPGCYYTETKPETWNPLFSPTSSLLSAQNLCTLDRDTWGLLKTQGQELVPPLAHQSSHTVALWQYVLADEDPFTVETLRLGTTPGTSRGSSTNRAQSRRHSHRHSSRSAPWQPLPFTPVRKLSSQKLWLSEFQQQATRHLGGRWLFSGLMMSSAPVSFLAILPGLSLPSGHLASCL